MNVQSDKGVVVFHASSSSSGPKKSAGRDHSPAILFRVGWSAKNGHAICFLLSMFPVWERTWAILNRPLFIVSCIVFPFDAIPQPYRDWLWFNPIIHLVGQMRRGIYATYDAAYVSPLYVFALSGVSLLVGLVMLGRYKSYIVNDG